MRAAGTYRGARRNYFRVTHGISLWRGFGFVSIVHRVRRWVRRISDNGIPQAPSLERVERIQIRHSLTEAPATV